MEIRSLLRVDLLKKLKKVLEMYKVLPELRCWNVVLRLVVIKVFSDHRHRLQKVKLIVPVPPDFTRLQTELILAHIIIRPCPTVRALPDMKLPKKNIQTYCKIKQKIAKLRKVNLRQRSIIMTQRRTALGNPQSQIQQYTVGDQAMTTTILTRIVKRARM